MKFPIIALLSVFLFISCNEKSGGKYTVKGSIKNSPSTTVYLEETTPSQSQPLIVDSAKLDKGGAFQLSTLSKGEALYSLRLGSNRYPFVSFINDTEAITINADLNNTQDPYTVKGSPASQSLKDYLVAIGTRLDALNNINYPADTLNYKRPQRDSIRAVYANQTTTARNGLKSYVQNFIAGSNNATLSLYALSSYQSIASNPAFGLDAFAESDVKTIIEKAAKKFPANEALQTIQKSLQAPVAAATNSAAPDFTLPDVTGKPVSLSSFKGKYVLVDFWASWCPPCRAENPNLVAAYNQYKDKNFTVLGVSLDRPGQKDAWLQAIKEDNLTWTHVSDLAFWDSKVVPLYNIQGIPYNVLLDPQGNIIAESLTGPALQKKLAEVLK